MKSTTHYLYLSALCLLFSSYPSIAQNDPFDEGDPFAEADENIDHRPKQIRIYNPTEYDPPGGLPPVEKDGKKAENGGNIFPANPATPTAFETRNLGHTLEVEPTLGDDGKTIDLRLAPETVKHVGDHVMSNWVFTYAKIKVARPTFYTKRLNTAVTVQDGEFLLASTYSPEKEGKTDHSRKILYFVRAEILIAGE